MSLNSKAPECDAILQRDSILHLNVFENCQITCVLVIKDAVLGERSKHKAHFHSPTFSTATMMKTKLRPFANGP